MARIDVPRSSGTTAAIAGMFPVKPGNWYTAPFSNISTRSLAAGNFFAMPIWLPACGVDRISCEVSTAQSGGELIRMGIYDDTGQGEPGDLLADVGTVAAATTGVKEVALASTLEVAGGLYWLGAVGQNITTAPVIRGHATPMPGVGSPTAANVITTAPIAYFVAGVTAALPATFGAPSTTTVGPRLAVRIA